MKSLLNIFSLLIIFSGCQFNEAPYEFPKTKDFKLLDITPQIDSKLFYSQFIDSITYIPLETSDNVLIGQNAQKVLLMDDSFFIFDEYRIFIFNLKGKYLNSFKLKGRGPGEMTWPTDFAVDKRNKTIEVLSAGDKKITSFDLKTCKLIDEYYLDFDAENIYKRNDGTYLFYGRKPITSKKKFQHNLFFYKNGSIVKSSLSTPDFINKYHGDSNNSFSKNEDGILYSQQLDNKFYLINSNNKVKIKYELNYTTGNIPPTEDFFNKIEYISDLFNTKYAFHFSGHIANDSYLYFRFFFNQGTFDTFYDVKHNKILTGNKIINDLDQGPHGYFVGINNNYFIGLIEPAHFIKHFRKLSNTLGKRKWVRYVQGHPEINLLLDSINPNDNQILMLCHLKSEFN